MSDTLDLRAVRDAGRAPAAPSDLTPREQTWTVRYTDPEGGAHSGTVVSRILNGDERLEVSRIAARLAGVPWDHLPVGQQARIWALATVAVQLRAPPAWVDRWAPQDDALLFTLAARGERHEAAFFRSDAGASGGDTPEPRVVIDPVVPA